MIKKQPHKHRNLIIAWANGAEIQLKNIYNIWVYIKNPTWEKDIEYRIKSEVIRYRVALFTDTETCTADTEEEAKYFENDRLFYKWITDWIEVEV